MMLSTAQTRSWNPFTYAFLSSLVAIGVWVGREPLADMWRRGVSDPEQSHMFLAPIVAAWLLWQRRDRLMQIQYKPNLAGPVLILLGWLTNWIGFDTDTLVARHVGALTIVIGGVIATIGVRALVPLVPALGVAVFVIPVPGVVQQFVSLPLQGIATSVTYAVLSLMDLDVQRSGYLLLINGTPVNVGEACNGLRMVLGLMLVVYAFVFSMPLRQGARIIMLVLSPLVALLCNIIRLLPTSVVYGLGSVDAAEQFHDAAGWVMLPIALGFMFGLLRVLRWLDLPVMRWRLAQ